MPAHAAPRIISRAQHTQPQEAVMTLFDAHERTFGRSTRNVGELRTRVAGPVVLPDGPAWDDARRAWNLAVDQRPAAVVFADSVDDIVAVVVFARANGLRVAAQGSGHGASSLPALDDMVRTDRGTIDVPRQSACKRVKPKDAVQVA
jgi:FAD binding domain